MSEQNRRDILKRMAGAATAGVSLGVAGTGVAAAEDIELAIDSVEATERQRLMHPQTGRLLNVLAGEGIIDRPNTRAIATDPVGAEAFDGAEGVSSYRLRTDSGTHAATVSTTRTGGGLLRLYVDSEIGPIALFEPDDGTDIVYHPNGSAARLDTGWTLVDCPPGNCTNISCGVINSGFIKIGYKESTGGIPCVPYVTCC